MHVEDSPSGASCHSLLVNIAPGQDIALLVFGALLEGHRVILHLESSLRDAGGGGRWRRGARDWVKAAWDGAKSWELFW